MSTPDSRDERLTEFERAICYDTLPRVTRPLTFGAVAGYTAALVASFLLIAYGVRGDHAFWKTWGTVAFAAVVCFGLIGFVYRALFIAVRQRAALAQAGEMPNVESGFDELPDPFSGHTLLRYFRVGENAAKTVTGNKGETIYAVTRVPGAHTWEVRDPAGEVVVRIEASRPPRSFSFDMGSPSQFRVMRGDRQTGEIERNFSFGPGRVDIRTERDSARPLVFREGGLYDGEALVGRVYDLRNYLYLDVRTSYLDDAVLAFYVCMLN